jgi:hypothetical protein
VLRQICQLIPIHLVAKLARETGADDKARTFTPWSHVVAMIYAQISHALSLNDVCDALKLHLTPLFGIRGAKPPAKNTLSHANKVRDCDMARRGIFWVTRAKDNLAFRVKKRLPRPGIPRILEDELIVLKGHKSRQEFPGLLRRVTARVEVEGEERVMVFLTNNTQWAASSVVELYGCRWEIETFFKELKQTVQLCAFRPRKFACCKESSGYRAWQSRLSSDANLNRSYPAHVTIVRTPSRRG